MPEVTDHATLEAHVAEIERLKAQVRLLTLRAEQAEALADYDVLTPMLNRRGFMRQVEWTRNFALRHAIEAVLIYLDMDGFKQINDQLGHAAGDAALIRVAEILQSSIRSSDAVGRLGGDEFGLVLMNAGLAAGKAKAAKLLETLAYEPFEFKGRRAELRGSFGVRLLENQSDAEQWLAEADAAMWLRKRQGRAQA